MGFRYVLLRVAASAAMAVAATLVVFLVAHTVPADPVLAQLGDKQSSNPETVARFRARWGLDRPLYQQYGIFLARLARGDLGESIASHRPIVVVHGNALEHVTDAYKRYLEGRIRDHFKLVGTPLRVELKSSHNPFDADRDR